jgi:carboxyl-terminal processing protease
LSLSVVGCSSSSGQLAVAHAYLERALTALQDHSMDLKAAAWPSINSHAESLASHARVPAETYEAIRYAITAIGDPHSRFLTPTQARSFNGTGATSYEPPTGALVDHRYAMLELPAFEGNSHAIAGYIADGERIVQHLDETRPCGWIVDLRGNTGGNMWPMLTVVLPLLRGSPVGYFVDKTGHRTAWAIMDGQIYSGSQPMVPQRNTYRLKTAAPAIAVLQDEETASSGEAVLVAFRGQRQAKTFGLASAGVPSGNTLVTLSDGAELLITEVRDADRTGHVYPNLQHIQPDIWAPRTTHLPPGQPWHPTAPAAATTWLSAQSACQAHR